MAASLALVTTRVCGGWQLRGTPVVGLGPMLAFCLPAGLIAIWVRFVMHAHCCWSSWLVEHGAYEVFWGGEALAVVWYLCYAGAGLRGLLFSVVQRGLPSIERWARNARWLERECAELLDLWYGAKRDRRALFLVPLIYWAPLRRFFPTAGFYELRLLTTEGRLALVHTSWLD